MRDRIKRFATGRFSFNDYMSVSSLFTKQENDEELKKYMKEEWADTRDSISDQERFSHILDRLHHRINLAGYAGSHSLSPFYLLISRVAVILLIPALVTIAFLSHRLVNIGDKEESWAEIYSPAGSRTQFQLPDGSKGWLNGGSSIKYPVNFVNNRNVEISGEAWFDVVHLNSREFRVNTPYFDLKVLGTKFNVVAYEDETTAEVILEKGKVVVLGKDQQVVSVLEPDQELVFDKTNGTQAKWDIDSKSYTSWKDGLLIFKNVPMTEIARRLERRYNAEILLHGDSLKSSIFRATFTDENLDEIIKLLSMVAPVKYEIHKREKLPDNTFTKCKIDMWLKN